jgi:hypothetical protein
MPKNIFLVLFLTAILCVPAFAATEQWVELRSAHFTVITDSNEKEGRRIVDQLERMRWVFQTWFGRANVDPAEPIVVLAAKNQKSFQALEPAAYLAKGQLKLSGLFESTPDKNYVLLLLDAQEEHPYSTIYHEYTHLQFRSSGEWMPLWLNEGVAEFFQNTEIQNKEVLLGEPSADDILYLRQEKIIPLPVLFRVDHQSPYYHEEQKGSVFYAESWALTHYLMVTDREKHVHRLTDYLELVSKNEDPVTAAEKAFGDLKRLQSDLGAYIHSGTYKTFVLSSAAAPIDESTFKIRVLSQAESDAYRAGFLTGVQRTADARALLDSILKADPNNVQAQETMGFLEMYTGNRNEALKWFQQAVKLNSQSYLAHYYFATLSGWHTDAGDDTEAEASLRAAIRLNPRFAPAFDGLATLLAKRHENLEEAHTLELQAVQLDPGKFYYRVNTANILMEMGRDTDALAVLKATLGFTKTPQDTEIVQSRIDELKRFQAARAEEISDAQAPAGGQVDASSVVVDSSPKHPTVPDTGPRHTALGVIQGVSCSYPSVIEFRVEGPKKTVSVYNNNYFKIELTALGFTPQNDINPCSALNGMTAQIEYVDSSDKTVDGQVEAVELRK